MRFFRFTPALLVAGCILLTLASVNHWRQLHSEEAERDLWFSEIRRAGPSFLSGSSDNWNELAKTAQALEQRLRKLEQDVQGTQNEANAIKTSLTAITDQMKARAAAIIEQAALPPPVIAGSGVGSASLAGKDTGKSVSKAPVRWRTDYRCGKVEEDKRLPDGKPVECNPEGDSPCCSSSGWCGASEEHCQCDGCVDYRLMRRDQAKASWIPRPLVRDPQVTTIAVMIPFRDREGHLEKFKEYWRWFAKEGSGAPGTVRWEIMVMEQFDSVVFNRGWCFNVGLAIASVQTSASPEISADMGIPYNCAIIQDIDYLPEKGVDYSQCQVPIQLSAEIDRYNWRTPYLESAGGIVGANHTHWYQINGFSNDYFGWGGEDDELHHRFRLNKLLFGDCHPFCTENDPKKGRIGISIKRPAKGKGRFSGEYMHSANHTKRITDCAAYKRNLGLLQEIRRGGQRWRGDGMYNLAFRIVAHEVDTSDSQYGITYRHIKAHRGREAFNLADIPLLARRDLCTPGASGVVESTLGRNWKTVPWTISALRDRVAEVLGVEPAECAGMQGSSFMLLDRRVNLAKMYPDPDEPRLLIVFYRYLENPAEDGLIIADSRPASQVVKAFDQAGAFWAPPMAYSVCSAKIAKGVKYGVNEGLTCQCGWEKIKGGTFYALKQSDTKPVAYCDNEKYWTQRIVQSESCPKEWSGLDWKKNDVFWVRKGNTFCVGSRPTQGELAFSKILPKSECGGDGFTHEFSFASMRFSRAMVPPSVCIGIKSTNRGTSYQLIVGSGSCTSGGYSLLSRFPAARQSAKTGVKSLCVAKAIGHTVDEYFGDTFSLGRDCDNQKATFSMPLAKVNSSSEDAISFRVCAGKHIGGTATNMVGIGSQCGSAVREDAMFNVPSLVGVAMSVPGAGDSSSSSTQAPIFTLVHEATRCASFLCDHLMKDES
mmetsp:Transcript_7881/g.18422  ORF Transcript_7881/g.18422 Transcript_7881/m.18422 type:complete len:936 (+) Transcript_7881:134-2941(+)